MLTTGPKDCSPSYLVSYKDNGVPLPVFFPLEQQTSSECACNIRFLSAQPDRQLNACVGRWREGGLQVSESPSPSPPLEALAFSGGEVVGHQRNQLPQGAAVRLPLDSTGSRNHQELCDGTTPPCRGHGPKDGSTWSFLCLTSQQCPAGLGFTEGTEGNQNEGLWGPPFHLRAQKRTSQSPVTVRDLSQSNQTAEKTPVHPGGKGREGLPKSWTLRTQYFCLLQVSCTAFDSKRFKLSSILFPSVKITLSLQRHCPFQWWTTYSYTGMPTRVCILTNHIYL